jgi:hypothetical protein
MDSATKRAITLLESCSKAGNQNAGIGVNVENATPPAGTVQMSA